MKHEEIAAGVRDCIANALDLEAQSLRLEDRIIEDLGGDSLDLLDIVFQLEQRFSVAISPRGIEQQARQALGSEPLENDGVYTPAALTELRKALPEVPPEELAPGLTTAGLPRRFRVATMVNLVNRLLEEKRGQNILGNRG
jgi:acyl carrier protein